MDRAIIKKRIITLLSAGLLTSMVSGTAFALSGEPIPFDNFAAGDVGIVTGVGGAIDTTGAVNGQITADCPTDLYGAGTVTCQDSVASDGMLQRQITVSGSADPTYDGTYIHFILIDNGASGDPSGSYFSTEHGSLNFIGEDFVKMNNRGEGIATKQTIIESKFDDTTFVEDRFAVSTTYKMGWARATSGLDDVWVDIVQSMSEIQYDGDITTGGAYGDATMATELFNEDVKMVSDGPALTNTIVDISQRMQLIDENNDGDAVQKFKHTRVTGAAYVNLSSDDFFGLINGNPLLPGGTNSGNLIWNVGDEMAATWVSFLDDGTYNSDFALTRYENKTAATETELVAVNPGSPDQLEAGGGLYSYSPTGLPALDAILVLYDGEPLWDLVWRSTGMSTYESLFKPAELNSYVNPVSMTDYSVQAPSVVVGAGNLDYEPNSDSTLPAQVVGDFNPTDSDYNNWTVTNGVFSGVACPVAADYCAAPSVNEDGMFQREFVVNGVTYYQTIMVADGTVTGDPTVADFDPGYITFRNESYVKADDSGSGIASRMRIAEHNPDTSYQSGSTATVDMPTDGGDFTQSAAMNVGWANQGSVGGVPDPVLKVNQTLSVTDALQIGAVSMYEQFDMERGLTESDRKIVHSSNVGTREGAGGFAQPIQFRSVTLRGSYQDTESLVGDPFTMVGDGTLAVPTGPQLLWAKGDTLQATWVGGEYSTFSPTVSIVGTTSFANLTASERIAYTSMVSPPDPDQSWLVDPFGPIPVYTP